MQKNQSSRLNNIGEILNEAEILLKEMIGENREIKFKSLRKQAALPVSIPLSNLFTSYKILDFDEEASKKLFRYGKFINEYLSNYLDEKYELYDIVEDYDVSEETNTLIDKWIDLEFQQNIMKYNQSKGGDFSEKEYKKISSDSEVLANEIYKYYGSFEWIKDAEKKMQKMEMDFAKNNPDYLKWASENRNQTSLKVFESKKNKPLNKPMRGDVKKYKVYVRDKKTGNIKKVNFGDPNMEIKRDDPERRKSFRARHNCDTATDKTTPRYWSCKFWSTKKVSDILNEIVDPKSIGVEYLKVKDQLNPKIWKNENKLQPQVRAALLKNAIEFIKFLNLEKLPIKDIRFTGSLANYTWTDFSDLDVHIVIDFNELDADEDTLRELFKTKKSLWETKIKAKVKGYDVELYVEDINEDVNSTGVYSLIKDQWIEKPIKQVIGIDTSDIQLKSASLMNLIDHLESLDDNDIKISLLNTLKEKLKNYRKAGLESEGEFSTENLVFKILRNNGYLKKIKNALFNSLNKKLSLEYENNN